MSTIAELIKICQDSSKINDFRVTHIQLLKASTEFFRANHAETDSIVILSIRRKRPVITSWSYNKQVSDAYTRAHNMCLALQRKANSDSCVIVWNTNTGKIEEHPFNTIDQLPTSSQNNV